MADATLGTTLTDLSETAQTQVDTSKQIILDNIGSTVVATSELDTTVPAPISTEIKVSPSTDNRVPVVYGTAYANGILTDARISNDSQTMYYVYAISEITGSGTFSVDEIWMNDQQLNFDNPAIPHQVTSATNADGTEDTNPAGLINVWVYRERTTPIFGATAGAANTVCPGWTTTDQMGGLIFAIVSVRYDSTKGIIGNGAMTFKITNSLSNPGAVWFDYMVSERYGAGIPTAQLDQELSINDSNPNSLYSVSDELVTYRDTFGTDQTGPRFRINGLIETGSSVKDNIRRINLASNSWTTWSPKIGKWVVIPNRPVSEVDLPDLFILDDSTITGGISVATTSLESNYNAIDIQYPETAIKAQNHNIRIDLFEDNPALLNAGEPVNQLSLTLDLVNDKVQATRIGLVELKQARENISTTFMANYSALQVDAGDVVKITNSTLGWNAKLFRVSRVREIETEDGDIQVEVAAVEYNADVYTDESIDQFEPVADTDIPRRASSGQLQALDPVSIPDDLYNPVATVPSFVVRAVIPENRIYDSLEFFISATTAGGIYTYYDTLRPLSGVFAPGSTHDLLITGLPTGQYFFKVRAKIDALTTPLSAASSGVTWDPGTILNEQALATAFDWSPATVVVPSTAEGVNTTTGQTIDLVLRVGTTVLNLSSATSDETQENNTWRVTNVTYNATNLNLSTPAYDTINDRVTWTVNGLTTEQENIIVSVRYKNSTGELNDLGTTRVLATQLRAGSIGSDSRSLNLISSSSYFQRLKGETDANTAAYLPSVINFTAELNNMPGAVVAWSAHDANDNPITLGVTGSTATLTRTNFGDRDYVVVHAEVDYEGITYFDEQTIVRLREGADGVQGITAILTNEVAALPAGTDGSYQPGDLADIITQIQIYSGTDAITSEYTLSIESQSGLVATIDTTPGLTYGRVSLTSVAQDLASATILATKSGSASIRKTFIVVKQIRGAAGSDGTDGTTARLLKVRSTSPIISIPKNSSLTNTATHQPASITYYADTINFSGTTITWTGQREGGSVVSLGTGTTLTLTAAQIRDLLTTSESVRTATITATTSYSGQTFTDTTSINRIREGSDTITGYLTNEVDAVPTDSSGVVIGSLTGYTSTLRVLQGGTDVSAAATNFQVVGSTGVGGAAITGTGVISFTSLTADAAIITVSADYAGTTVSKTYSIVKQRQGQTGTTLGVKLSATTQFFVAPAGGSGYVTTPSSITLTAARINIPGTQAVSYYTVIGGVETLQTGTPNGTTQLLYFTTGSLTPSITAANFANRDSLTIRAKCTYNSVTYTDDYTIARLQQGESAVTGIIDNEVITVVANTDNSIIAGQLPVAVSMRVFIGATDDTANWTFSAANITGAATFYVNNNLLTVDTIPALGSSQTVRRDVIGFQASRIGYASIVKEFAVQVIRSARSAAAQMVLTNEVHNLPADSAGVITSYSQADTTVYVYQDGAPATDWTMSATASTPDLTYTTQTSGLPTGAIRKYVITGWAGTGRQAYLSIYANKGGQTQLVKTFNLVRSVAGAPGEPSPILKMTATAQVVKTTATGTVISPTSITLTGVKSGGLTGTPTWTITSGSATLSATTGNSITVATNTISTDSVRIRATIGSLYDEVTIVKVADGAAGVTGPAGNRGSRNFEQTSTTTSFNYTTAYLAAQVSGGPIPGDTVSQTNAGAQWTETRIWTGAIAGANNNALWQLVGTIIDGNLLVTGSVKSTALYTTDTYSLTVQSPTFVSGSQGWRIDRNGTAEFSNITARGNIEAAGIYTGSTLRDKYVYSSTTKDYPIYTTATRTLTPVVYTNNTKPIPVRPTIDNWGAPSTDVNYLEREVLTGPFAYNIDVKENYVGIRSGFADSVVAGTSPGALFATSGSWGSGGDDRIENRVRRFLSTTDEIAFGGSISLTTNAPMLEVFYYLHNDEPGVTGFNTLTTPFYNKIRPIARYYNPILYRRIRSDSGSSIQPLDENIIRTGPWRATAISNVSFNGATKLQVTLENFNSISVAVGDTFHLAGSSAPTSSINEWAGALTTTGGAWTPGTITLGVGAFDGRSGVKVIGVVNSNTIILDCSFANAGTYGSGVLGFNTVGEQWINYSNQDILTNLNDVWTFNFTSKVKWSDFYSGTAPAFPTGGIKGWSLHLGVRAPESYYWWHINPYITGYIQNL